MSTHRKKYFFKYLILLSIIALLPLWFVSHQLINTAQRGVETALMELLIAKAEASAENFNNYTNALGERMAAFANMLSGKKWNEKIQLFNQFVEMNSDVKSLSAVSVSGKEIIKATSPGNTDDAKLVLYAGKDFIKVKNNRNITVYFSANKGNLVCYYPPNDKIILRTEAKPDKVFKMMKEKSLNYGGFAALIDSKGDIFIPPDQKMQEFSISKVRDWPIFKTALKNTMGSGSLEFNDSGISMLGAYSPMRNIDGAAIIVQKKKTAYKYMRFSERDAVLMVAFVMLLVFIMLVFVSWRLAGRLSGEISDTKHNPLKCFWDSLKGAFQNDSRFPWGRLSLISLPLFIGGFLIVNYVKSNAAAIIGTTAFFVFLSSLMIWADKAVARRDIRRAFMLPLRIILNVLAGLSVLGLVAWLGLLIYLTCV